jgi:membrane peptidoglycan carboxypeptidase
MKRLKKILKILLFISILFPISVFTQSLMEYISNKNVYLDQIEEWKLWLYGKAKQIPVPIIHHIYDRNQQLIGEFTPIVGSYIPLNRCKKLYWLNIATILSEDEDFYQHKGISYKGIIRAMWYNLTSLSMKQGGGTITQQLARTLFTGHEKTFQRKILETILAKKIEEEFTKEEILCLYLNKIYMGNGRYGAEEASWFYFNKPPEKLTAAEASLIVGLYPSPSRYNPIKNLSLSLEKQEIILNKLVKKGYITKEEKTKELREFYNYYKINKSLNDPGSIAQYGASRYFRLNKAPAVNEAIKNFLEENIIPEILNKKNLNVYTTVDLTSQEIALKVLRENINKIRKENLDLYGKYKLNKDYISQIEGVLVSIDIPSGYIRALVGGYEIYESGILSHRIFRMKRQVGSTIKGFLYALALEQGIYKIDSMVIDEPINFAGYSPKNWYGQYLGEVTLKKAIARSINTVAVKTLNQVGIDYFHNELTQALGISYFDAQKRFPKNLSIALGTFELTPIELTLIYAALLNEGYKITPILIQKIESDDNIVFYEDSTVQKNISIIKKDTSAAILELLRGVVEEEEDGTAGWIGKLKNQNPNYLPYDIAGKSGTTQIPSNLKQKYNYIPGIKDSWFVGMIPINVTTIWVGHDRGYPFKGQAVSIWADYIANAFPEPLPQKFPEYKKSYLFEFFNKSNKDFE